MKTFLILLLMLNFTIAFAGNGVVTGDGHPVDLTKQEKIETTTVDQELVELTSRLAAFAPEVAHMINVGVAGILDKNIILIKIQENSHEHFTFIEGGKIYKSSKIGYGLNSYPTIYFYENYFTQPVDKKLKILIHEFMHLYLGSSELKVQRVTDLIFQVSSGQFTEKELQNLYLELGGLVSGLYMMDSETKLYNCNVEVGLKYLQTASDANEVAFMPLPSQDLLEQFDTFTPYAKKIFAHYSQFLFGHSLRHYKSPGSQKICKLTDINKLNLEQMPLTTFTSFIYSKHILSPKFSIELSIEQKEELSAIYLDKDEYYFAAHTERIGVTRKYDITPYLGIDSSKLLKRYLKTPSVVSISKLDYVENINLLFTQYKKLQTLTGSGEILNPEFAYLMQVLENQIFKMKSGKYSASETSSISCNGCYKDLFEDFKKGQFIISDKMIEYISPVINSRKNSETRKELIGSVTVRTALEFAE